MDNYTATQLLQSLQAGHEGIRHLDNCIQNGELNISDLAILDDLSDLLSVVENSTATVSTPNRVKEINANIMFYINELKENATHDNVELFLYDFRFHFSSLYRILEFEVAYIAEDLVSKRDYPRFYPEIGVVRS